MLYESAYFSLIIQFIVGIVNIYGLNIDIPNDKIIFKDILKIEFVVQIIEFIFYSWMIINLKSIENITPYRYLDWIITTPTMLLTLIIFLSNKDNTNLKEYMNKNKFFIIKLFILNLIMILFGLAGELNYIDYSTAIVIGFIPFIYYFKMIYDKYLINNEDINKIRIYWFFLIIWAIYGIAAFLPYDQKNIAYNILDLFSKNLFSVYLVLVILNLKKNSIQSSTIENS
jgi:bacteriorhodopsin